MTAPLIFTHYGNPDYLAFTLGQAKKSNPSRRCILLGDFSNRDTAFSADWEHCEFRRFRSLKRDAFNAGFFWIQGAEHNPVKGGEDWLRYVSERFFCLEAFLLEEKVDAFWHFDSDTMLLHDLDGYEQELSESQFDAFTLCNDACPSGYLTTKLITKFCKSMIDDYEDEVFIGKILEEFKSSRPTHAFTEMEAFCRFREKSLIQTVMLSSFFSSRGIWFDDCMCQSHGFEFVNAPRLGKKIKNFYRIGKSLFCKRVDGAQYEFATVNCSWVDLGIYEWILSDRFKDCQVPVHIVDSLKKGMLAYLLDLAAKLARAIFYTSRSMFRRLR